MQGHRSSLKFAVVVGAAAGLAGALCDAAPARAEECPGHPDALGTSRVLVVRPDELSRVGSMQYHESLPLADKEVVLTFDDGPLPRYSNPILDILAAQCVKATYFLVGDMARAYPATVRRIYEEGHSIGTHTEDHPPGFEKLSRADVRQEIDDGIADVGAALGDPRELAPFFRIPGLARTDVIEQELAARSLVVFSTDVVADDWHRRIKAREIVRRAITRLQAHGKGILLLHDIHPATVAALPDLLKKLKDEGFHIVHVVPAPAEPIAIAGWPALTTAPTDDRIALPAPDVRSFATNYRPGHRIILADRSANAGYLALAAAAEWPEPSGPAVSADAAELPAPDIRDIGLALLEFPGGNERLGLSATVSLTGTDQSAATAASDATSSPAAASTSPLE
jgi:peptidoglycan-N-acetylglucosamine deacetylase